jgi:hypothetical protein
VKIQSLDGVPMAPVEPAKAEKQALFDRIYSEMLDKSPNKEQSTLISGIKTIKSRTFCKHKKPLKR